MASHIPPTHDLVKKEGGGDDPSGRSTYDDSPFRFVTDYAFLSLPHFSSHFSDSFLL